MKITAVPIGSTLENRDYSIPSYISVADAKENSERFHIGSVWHNTQGGFLIKEPYNHTYSNISQPTKAILKRYGYESQDKDKLGWPIHNENQYNGDVFIPFTECEGYWDELETLAGIEKVLDGYYRPIGNNDNPFIPFYPAATLEEAIECVNAGASIVHLHTRQNEVINDSGYQYPGFNFCTVERSQKDHPNIEASKFVTETLRQTSQVEISFSTGDRSGMLSPNKRFKHLELEPDSCTFPPVLLSDAFCPNKLQPHAKYLRELFLKHNITPEIPITTQETLNQVVSAGDFLNQLPIIEFSAILRTGASPE